MNIYLYLFNYLIILKFYASTRVVKNYSTLIWSRVLAILELLGTALHRTIRLMQLIASTMLFICCKEVHCFLCYVNVCQFLAKFVEQEQIGCFVHVTLTNIASTPLDRSAALVLSIINWTYCSCTGVRQIRLEIWPEPDLAGFPKSGWILDLLEQKSSTSLPTEVNRFKMRERAETAENKNVYHKNIKKHRTKTDKPGTSD